MHTELITMPKAEAEALYRKYKSHVHYDKPEQSIDAEIRRTYQLIAQGKTIIRAIESIKQAGLNREFLPKLAIGPATARECHLLRRKNGGMVMAPSADFWRERKSHFRFAEETFVFPTESFPMQTWGTPARRTTESNHKAVTPVIPMHLRPKRGLANYHILWEAEWRRMPPTDPYLLRRIGKADLWLVMAAWDLTEVERAAMSTRI